MSTQKVKHERPGARVDPTAVASFVGLRIPPGDLDVIKTEAEAVGMSLSAFIRSAAVGTATTDALTRHTVLDAYVQAVTVDAAPGVAVTVDEALDAYFSPSWTRVPDPEPTEKDSPMTE